MEALLKCGLCRSNLNQPLMGPCLHSFCYNCLHGYVKTGGWREHFPCPTCRRAISLPLENLPTSLYLQNLTEIMEKRPLEKAPCDQCLEEGDDVIALNRCLVCKENLCAECTKAHKKTKLTKTHTTYSLDEVRKGTHDKDMRKEQQHPCMKHPDEPIRAFCSSCSVAICQTCHVIEHGDRNKHQIIDVTSAHAQCSKVLKQQQDRALGTEELEEELFLLTNEDEKNASAMTSFSAIITKRAAVLKQELDDIVAEIVSASNEQKRRIDAAVTSSLQDRSAEVGALKNVREIAAVRAKIEDRDAIRQLVTGLTGNGNAHEVMHHFSALNRRLQELTLTRQVRPEATVQRGTCQVDTGTDPAQRVTLVRRALLSSLVEARGGQLSIPAMLGPVNLQRGPRYLRYERDELDAACALPNGAILVVGVRSIAYLNEKGKVQWSLNETRSPTHRHCATFLRYNSLAVVALGTTIKHVALDGKVVYNDALDLAVVDVAEGVLNAPLFLIYHPTSQYRHKIVSFNPQSAKTMELFSVDLNHYKTQLAQLHSCVVLLGSKGLNAYSTNGEELWTFGPKKGTLRNYKMTVAPDRSKVYQYCSNCNQVHVLSPLGEHIGDVMVDPSSKVTAMSVDSDGQITLVVKEGTPYKETP